MGLARSKSSVLDRMSSSQENININSSEYRFYWMLSLSHHQLLNECSIFTIGLSKADDPVWVGHIHQLETWTEQETCLSLIRENFSCLSASSWTIRLSFFVFLPSASPAVPHVLNLPRAALEQQHQLCCSSSVPAADLEACLCEPMTYNNLFICTHKLHICMHI